jgi:hypothetical protein
MHPRYSPIAPQFVPYPLPKSVGLYCMYVSSRKIILDYFIESKTIWGALKALILYKKKRPIKMPIMKKHIEF